MFACPVAHSALQHKFYGKSCQSTLRPLLQLGKNKIQLFGFIEKGKSRSLPDIPVDFDCCTDETCGGIDSRLYQTALVVSQRSAFSRTLNLNQTTLK